MANPSKEGKEQNRQRRDQIASNLKRVYDETLNEPLPERLAELLDRLKRQGEP